MGDVPQLELDWINLCVMRAGIYSNTERDDFKLSKIFLFGVIGESSRSLLQSLGQDAFWNPVLSEVSRKHNVSVQEISLIQPEYWNPTPLVMTPDGRPDIDQAYTLTAIRNFLQSQGYNQQNVSDVLKKITIYSNNANSIVFEVVFYDAETFC